MYLCKSCNVSHSDLKMQNVFQHLIHSDEKDSFIFSKCFRTKWEINPCFHHCMHCRAEVHYRLCRSAELQILSFLHGAQMSISEHEQLITAVKKQRCSWLYLFKLFLVKELDKHWYKNNKKKNCMNASYIYIILLFFWGKVYWRT